MEKISVAIITFNEQDNIERCLQSVSWADEIIVVDSRSTDDTVKICRRYTKRVFIRDWPGYIAQKKFAVDRAANEWILSLDADEVVSSELRQSIMDLQTAGFRHSGYRLARKVFYLGKWIRHSGWYPDYKIRLFRRDKGDWVGGDVHERVELSGACGTLKGDLLHYSYNNIQSHINQVNEFTRLAAQNLYENGQKSSIFNLILNPVFKFIKTYFIKMGILDGKAGFFIAVIGSFYVFLKYLKLWELHNQPDIKLRRRSS